MGPIEESFGSDDGFALFLKEMDFINFKIFSDYNIEDVNINNIHGPKLAQTILDFVKEPFDTEYMLEKMLEKLKTYEKSNSTLIHITLDRSSSKMYQRKLAMEYELFIGCIGGIMALFTGFSFIGIY